MVAARKSRVAPKKPYICSGTDEIWGVDQHDKFKKWGLWLHVGLDTFSARVLWLKVWWTNSNPRLICKYFLDAIEEQTPPRKFSFFFKIQTIKQATGMPMLTQSDPGTENFGIANVQSTLCQMLDSSLSGTMQHIRLRKHGNIKPEVFWAGYQKQLATGLEPFISIRLEEGFFNPDTHIEL